MSHGLQRTATVLIAALVASAVLVGPGAALSANATVDDPAPGAVGDYTVTLEPEEGDAVTENGLKSVTLDFGADRDYSGDLGNLTGEDVEVRVGDSNGTVWAGPATVNQSSSEVTITLEEAFRNVKPGDRIVVRVFGVTNTEIALRNAQTLRGFAIRASVTDTEGNTDGPVEARYAIDPEATPQQTPTEEANDSAETTDDGDVGSAETSTDPSTNETTGETTSTENTANGSGTTDGSMNATDGSTITSATTMNETTETATATSTETTSTEATTETTQPATTGGNDGNSGGQATETTGPGFGLVAGLVALLAAGLLATRRRD